MENNLKGLELVKELNSKRTQGEWICQREYIGVPSERVTHFDGTASDEQDAINAQYTALAVNNFASVVDALNESHRLIKYLQIKYITMAKEDDHAATRTVKGLAKIEKALNNIKL